VSCCICKKDNINKSFTLYDDRYAYPGLFKLMDCQNCGHKFLVGIELSSEVLTDLYTNYYPRSELNLENYKQIQEKKGLLSWLDGEKSSVFRWVPKKVRILDIGCGFGQSLGYHESRGCEVYGVEADENIRRVADKFGYNVHVGLFDSNVYDEKFFDYVSMDQVLEHVVDPIDVLKGIAKILKDDGKLIVSVPNASGWGAKVFGRKWINWHTPYHLHFYSEKSIQIAAKEAGLEVVEAKTVTPSAWLHYQWLHLLTYPKSGEPSSFWAGSTCGNPSALSFQKRILSLFLSAFYKLKVNHLITRFLLLLLVFCFLAILESRKKTVKQRKLMFNGNNFELGVSVK